MSEITDRAAKLNREAWNFTRRQRDEGRVKTRNDSAADILAGKYRLSPEILSLAGDVKGKRLLDMGCGDAVEVRLIRSRSHGGNPRIDDLPVSRNLEILNATC